MKKGWKQWISAALVVVLLFSMPIFTYAEESVVEWTYDNSIVVSLSVPEFQTFEPEDFPEINCSRVVVACKEIKEDGVYFLLVLVLRDYGQVAVEKALEIAQQDERVSYSSKNERYQKCEGRVILNYSQLALKIGETVNLKATEKKEEYYVKEGVFFRINSNIIDNDTITKDSFISYGISHFWPCKIGPNYSFPYPDLNSLLEGCKSETGEYYTPMDSENHTMEIADRLAREPSISSVYVNAVDPVPPGNFLLEETWEIDQPELVSLTNLQGKETTIRGLKPGTATITFTSEFSFSSAIYGTCTIQILDEHCDGDINKDAWVNASDALLALQHSVNLIGLEEEQKQLADMDDNNTIDAADALNILQISVGLLP